MRILLSTKKIFQTVTTSYHQFLIRKPVLAQAIQVSVLMGAGDIIAQTFVEKKLIKDIDVYRTLKFTGLGFCFIGPCLRVWYGQLEKIAKMQYSHRKLVIIKVGLDQLVFAPVFLAAITSIISIMQGMDIGAVKKRLQNEYWPLLRANYCLWPAVQLLNFAIIPLNYQVLFVQIVALAWNTFLSTMLN